MDNLVERAKAAFKGTIGMTITDTGLFELWNSSSWSAALRDPVKELVLGGEYKTPLPQAHPGSLMTFYATREEHGRWEKYVTAVYRKVAEDSWEKLPQKEGKRLIATGSCSK